MTTVQVSVCVRDGDGNAPSKAALVDEQVAALPSTSDSEVQRLVESTLSEGSSALAPVPSSYESGTATAESTRIVFEFAGVVISALWMFGILGWMQIPAGMTMSTDIALAARRGAARLDELDVCEMENIWNDDG